MAVLANILLALLLVHYSLGSPLSRQVVARPKEDSSKYRLPTNLKPVSYIVKLTPNIKNGKFEGSVEITIKVKENTKQITLHSKSLVILKNNIKIEEIDDDGTVTTVDIVSAGAIGESDKEFFGITLARELKVCYKYILKISKFTGVLNINNVGFYIAKYKDENGAEKKFATTQFEPTRARMAFPCFDEPALKAKFTIILVKPNKDYVAVSNTPIADTRDVQGSDQVEVEFEETIEMSTYLLAFIVSEMKLSDTKTLDKVKHRILARPEAIKNKNEEYALDVGSKILKKIQNFVNISYSLPKMDQAAIPDKYFSAGAMENWGLVTYKEMYLLYSDKTTTTTNKQFISTTIAHEFGHQWFGNLVSPQWWKYLWLNEGFATYFEYRGADLVESDWGILEQFVVKNTQYAFGPDGLNNTRPMNYDAGSPTSISGLFDRVAYEKSGSVIRMIEMSLTTEVFKKGLHYYLDTMKYKDACPENLYDALQQALDESTSVNLPEGLTITKIMDSWANKEGYPVVYVKRQYFADSENTVVSLSQSRFLLKSVYVPYDSSWIIPINFATKTNDDFTNTTAEKWLTVKEDDVNVKDLKIDNWLIVNKQQTGYYRVNYDITNWNLLTNALLEDHSKIDLLNRAQLIDDSFNLARSGRLSYDIPFELSLYLKNETDYIPFYSFFTAINFVNTMLSESPGHDIFKKRIINTLDGIYKQLSFEEKEDDKHKDKLNRLNVLKWLCDLGHTECRTKSLTKLREWMSKGSAIPVDLQSPVFCGALRTGNETEWQFLYGEYEKVVDGTDTDLVSRIRNAMGCSENVEILEKFLEESVAGTNKVTAENAFAAVYNSGSIGVKVTFEYVLKHFKTIHSKLGTRLMTILNGIGSKLTTGDQLTKLQELSQDNKEQLPLFRTAIANAEENVNWNNNRLLEITNWLNKANKGNISHGTYSSIFVIILSCLISYFIN